MTQDPRLWKSIDSIPAKSELTVLSADDDILTTSVPISSRIAKMVKSGNTVGFSVTEKIGVAVMNPSVAKMMMMKRDSMDVCATLGESGWSLKAGIHETGRSPAYASISLETSDFSTHVMNVTSSLNFLTSEKCDSETSDMYQLVEVSHVDSVKAFALIVMEKAEDACSPASGNMLPSQRSKIKHLPPLEWEGWSSFLNEVSSAIEVFDVMVR